MVRIAEEDQAVIELSINSVVGLSNLGTVKVRGRIKGREVVVLIDCGATHNFILETLVDVLQVSTKETSHYGMILGFGTAIKGKGVCEAVELLMEEWTVIANFQPLELGGADVVLGMQWLYSLGITEVDWRNLVMTFDYRGRRVVIKGHPSLTKTKVSLKNLMKSWENCDHGFLVECLAMEGRVLSMEEDGFDDELTVEE